MAHINYIRRIGHLRRLSVRSAVAASTGGSFAAFCGTNQQRTLVGLYEIRRFCGSMGVVLLHNDLQLEEHLGQLYAIESNAGTGFRIFLANQAGFQGMDSFYDPLYGFSDSAILDLLVPSQRNASATVELQALRAILADYLTIMRQRFDRDPGPFGDYPYNLDLLLELTRMPYSTLHNRVLAWFPDSIRRELSGRLSAEEAQQKAYNAVLSFAQGLGSFLWTQRGFAGHSCLSAISAVRDGDFISIYIPESRADVLDYLAAELQQLCNARIPYLLAESGLDLNASPRLKGLFLSEHSDLPYCTGILAEDTSSVVSGESGGKDLTALFSQTQEMFVFACSSTIAAQPFSDGIGTYYRLVREHHTDTRREPLHFFASHGYGTAQREVVQHIVTAEELTSLGAGCLMYGRNHPIPTLVDRFTF